MPDPFDPTCPFCAASGRSDQYVVLESTHCRYLRKAQPKLTGAGLIVPRIHRETVFDLSKVEWEETFDLLGQAKELLTEQFDPDGYTVGWNIGSAGGQHIAHAHLHVIPRFAESPNSSVSIRDVLRDGL